MTKEIIRQAMEAVAKDVRKPKAVREGKVKPEQRSDTTRLLKNINLLKAWVSQGQVRVSPSLNPDDLFTLINQLEIDALKIKENK